MQDIQTIPLSEETQRRYLNYALSVITSRALPDVRDGLKPVQRRILYTMFHDLRLTPDARYRKCAKVVGDVMGNYHPHGDTRHLRRARAHGAGLLAALPARRRAGQLRLARRRRAPRRCATPSASCRRSRPSCSTRSAPRPSSGGRTTTARAASRWCCRRACRTSWSTARRASPSAWRPRSRRTTSARWSRRASRSSTIRALESKDLLKFIKGPDFPTGGQVLASKRDLKEIYEAGSGSLKLRGEWELEEPKGRKQTPTIVITSIPYGPTKQSIVEKIGEIIRERKLPQLVDVLDQSTTDVRIELEIKKDADPALIMAYLYKNTRAPDQRAGQPDLPGADGQPGGRPPRAAQPQGLPAPLPRLPLRGGHAAPPLRSRRAQPPHPHPRGLRQGLRRARRGHPHHPQVRGQGRRGATS